MISELRRGSLILVGWQRRRERDKASEAIGPSDLVVWEESQVAPRSRSV